MIKLIWNLIKKIKRKKWDHWLKMKVYYENIFVILIICMFLFFLNNEWKLN